MTLLREVIDIPTSVGDADFVVRASEKADLSRYVVTDDLRRNFDEALAMVGHAVRSGRSQAKFLHGSFGSGKSHFMAVLREILRHNPDARMVANLGEPVARADEWLRGKNILTLTFHMLDARSTEQAILEGYLRQVTALHPDAPPPAVHRSDRLLDDAAGLRDELGDERFFARLRAGREAPSGGGGGLAALRAQAVGWTAESYARAAAAQPGTKERDTLVSALTTSFFTGAVHSGEYLDIDTGLAVVTRHAKELGYDALVLFLDELILWLSTKIADHTFVQTEGSKLNKLVESADTARPLPIASFVARQRNLEEFLGPQVGGTERAALADVMRSVQGRMGEEIVLADTNLPEITEKRLLKPFDGRKQVIDDAFAAVRSRRDVWDVLLLGAQYGDAGIGSDAASFRRLYPFSPALVATLVALSQALQRERTALKVMTQLLVERRETLRVNDLIGVAALFDPLVLRGELPDRPQLRQLFEAARNTYQAKLRPLLLAAHDLTDAEADRHDEFALDDRIVKTLILGALVAEVPALHNLTAAKLHALNFGSIQTPIPGYENHIVLDRLRRLAADAGQLHLGDGPDPVVSMTLSSVDYDRLLDLVPHNETATGVLQQMVREMISKELGLESRGGTFGEVPFAREWRGRRHSILVRFGNVRDKDTMPDNALIGHGDGWRVVIDYPFDPGHRRNEDFARIETLERDHRTVLWMPLFLTDEVMGRVGQLAKINYLLGSNGTNDRLSTVAADWSLADRQQGKVYLQQRQQQLVLAITEAFKQAYGAAAPTAANVEPDSVPVLHCLTDGVRLGDSRGGTLRDAFHDITGTLLKWTFPGTPALPDDEKPINRIELGKVLKYAKLAAADPTRGVAVDPADQRTIRRICNPLRLGELHEHRYVLKPETCWWTGHLTKEAAKPGREYRDRFPVHALRKILDEPDHRGFERDLQNLIIAVFAEEQQLAWYRHGFKMPVDAVAGVEDDIELRNPPMPEQDDWDKAIPRGEAVFGRPLPTWRIPSNLGEVASTIRGAARLHVAAASTLRARLEERVTELGLDPLATTGRLATARRVAALLETLVGEPDDVNLVGRLARADLGEIDDAVASLSFTSAGQVIDALARAQWGVLAAVRSIVATSDEARGIIDRLHATARHEQHADDLATALTVAGNAAADLLARIGGGPGGGGGSGGGDGGDGGGSGTGEEQDDGGSGDGGGVVPPRRNLVEVDGTAALGRLVAALQAEVEAGRTVTVSWEAR
ncbi:phage resistance protein [Asanoa iriomotensis]|uniref:Phage resistance protein n=1 Tax=Asanoa iriomotensis TaxID=234613 RepID=A0ABQ4C1L2_9ACTN|nr:phage resistance protein [Asanoa iriomotensis]GIF56652.1 hypothetical protein Air01nite_27470 [Asanoa iriomotensis]